MDGTAEVTAGEIARIAGVGRAAVSNWRKRFDGFPEAIGGTSASPTFRLTDVETWLIANDRMPPQSGEDRLWRALQYSSSDPEREIPAIAGALLALYRHGETDSSVNAGVVEIAKEIGLAKALTFLANRFIDLRGRRGPATTSVPVTDLMVELADPAGKTVLDPACRTGRLLAAAAARGAVRVLGQDADVDNVTIAAASLGVAAANADIRHGTLRDDAFPDAHADVVLSDPPTGGNWGFDELAADMRWEYSTPPRTETELAWVQHALARLRPGGTAILLLPPGVAERTAGRRIRRELVRRGALEAIIALPSGATPPHNMRLHLWVMCRPLDRRTAREVLMVDAQGSWDECLATIRAAMSAHADSRPLPDDLAGRAAIVEAVGLVGEDVDLTPSRHISSAQSTVSAAEIAGRRDQLLELLKRLPTLLPPTTPGDDHSPAAEMTVGDLAKAGLLTVHPPGETPIQAGDVLVPTVANRSRVVVATGADDGRAIGPQFTMLRVDPRQLDPWFIAGFVFADANLKRITSLGSIPRVDVRKAQIPRLPLERQRGYGEYLRRLHEFADLLQSAAADGEEVVHMVTEGLVRGTLGSES